MKRLLHFLARAYPRSWRERYGTEFAALLDDSQPRWFDIVDLLKGGLAMQVMRSRISVLTPNRRMARVVTNEIAGRFIEGGMEIHEEDAIEGRAVPIPIYTRVRIVAPAATAPLRVNPLAATSAGLAGGLVLSIAAGWVVRRRTAGRSTVAPGQS